MDFWTLALSWYVGVFLMSVWHGYQRYKNFVANRKTAAMIVLMVSAVWPFASLFLIVGIPFSALIFCLWHTFTNGYTYLIKFMDDVMRKVIR